MLEIKHKIICPAASSVFFRGRRGKILSSSSEQQKSKSLRGDRKFKINGSGCMQGLDNLLVIGLSTH